MAEVGDYVVLSDPTVSLSSGQEWEKDIVLPTTAARRQKAILWFMLDTMNPNALKFHVEVDGTSVMSITTESTVARGYHEVIDYQLPPDVKTVKFKVDSGTGILKVSDIVLFFKNNV